MAFADADSSVNVLQAVSSHIGIAPRRTKNKSTAEIIWLEMTAADDLLLDALRLEQQFNKADFIHADDDTLDRWREHRESVERLARHYADAMSHWRESLQIDSSI